MIFIDMLQRKRSVTSRLIPTSIIALVCLLMARCSDGSGFAGSNGKKSEVRREKANGESDLESPPIDANKETGDQGSKTIDSMESSEAPSHAIKKGSFAAWTDPKNPQDRQSYTINIEVRLPPNTASYNLSDLDGTVRGTDYFVRNFGVWDLTEGVFLPPPFRTSFEFKGSKATIRVPIPGGARNVRDVIKIKSSLLKESQEMELEFGRMP
jgi:hypothetical protein